MEIRAVIIEDEAVNARNLEFLLSELNSNVRVIAVLRSVKESVDYLSNHLEELDLMFMDIRLTDGISFEILDKVPVTKPIIFTTAYEEYALKAFNTYGIAYILKPFDKEELSAALNKYQMMFKEKNSDSFSSESLKMVLHEIQNRTQFKNSFLFQNQNRLIPVKADSIAWFYSKNEITRVCTFNGMLYHTDDTLESLITKLDSAIFFRANRQFIINRNAVESIDFYFNGRLLVKIHPAAEESLIVSKAKATAFRNWLNT